MNYAASTDQKAQAFLALPKIEAVLARLGKAVSTEQAIGLAEILARPLFEQRAALFRELLLGEIAATPESDAVRREYFGLFAAAQFTTVNAEGLLRMMLAVFCAINGTQSAALIGDELTPGSPPAAPEGRAA